MLFLEHSVVPVGPQLVFPEDLPHYGVPEAHIDDFDDTLSDTTAALNGLLRVCNALGFDDKINANAVADARERAWRRGGSYNMLKLLGEHLDETAIHEVRQRFRYSKDGPNMAFDDTANYQERLREAGYVPHFVMTYGEQAEMYPCGGWQRDKLERAMNQGWWPTGFAYFMPHSEKGPEVASLINSRTGSFEFVGIDAKGKAAALISAKRALLIDDRKTSLAGSIKECSPIYIRRPERAPTPKQTEGDLPGTARTICSLDEIAVNTSIRALNDTAAATDPASLQIRAFVPLKLL